MALLWGRRKICTQEKPDVKRWRMANHQAKWFWKKLKASTDVIGPVSLGDVCGTASSTTGHCTSTHSACVEFSQDKRKCQCVRNYVRKGSGCVQAPTLLTSKRIYNFEIGENLQGSVGRIITKTYDGISLNSYQVTTYSANNAFTANILDGRNIHIETSRRQITPGTYNFVLKISAQADHVNIIDIVMVTVTVKQIITPADVILFISDGTLKNAIIDNVRTRTVFQDSTYKLTITASEFGVRDDGTVYCKKDIFVNEIAGENYVAVERNFNVTASKESSIIDLAYYKILIVKNSYKINLDENQESIVAQFSLLSDNFIFSSNDLPLNQFTLAPDKISVAMLDYESSKSFDFNVMVTTKDKSYETKVKVNIMVNDLNDEPPVFEKKAYSFHTLSNTLSDTVVGVLAASDQDTVGDLYYKINGNSEHKEYFTVNERTGALKSLKSLTTNNFGSSITIKVDVCDEKSSSARCDSATVTITLIPITIETRDLGYTFTGSVKENEAAGTAVTKINVPHYTGYISINMKSSSLYSIDKTTVWHSLLRDVSPVVSHGNIITKKSLDREERTEEENNYIIQAYEEGKDQCFMDNLGTITITVTDKNDNSPSFSKELYSGTVDENSPVGTEVHFDSIILVTDRDSGDYGSVTFTLSGTESSKFSIDSKDGKIAVIKTKLVLDRETLSPFGLLLIATDGRDSDGAQHSSTTSLTISVNDVNDNKPVFDENSYSTTVTEEEEPKVILTVNATDMDSGLNGKVTYRIISGGLGYFSIDETKGSINTTQKIDREKYKSFSLTVVASDSGNPSMNNHVTVLVTIADINDNDPVIADSGTVEVEENVACSTPITTISASDADEGLNANITFTTTNSKFQISSAGVLKCVNPLDYEEQSYHNVVIIATDGGSTKRSTEHTIVVTVKDVNDNAPQFSTLEYTTNITKIELRENKPVIVVDATDADTGKNGQIKFSFTHHIFNVTSTNNVGVIRVKSGVNKGQPGTYEITVIATDGGTPPLTNQTTITIMVIDSTASAVHFGNNDFMFTMVEEREYKTQAIGTVVAVYDENAVTVEYNLPESLSSKFHIDSRTGQLYCYSTLDREQQSSHQIVVRAYSVTNKKDGDVALITIKVTDINDNSPQFTVTNSNKLIFEVPENKLDHIIYTMTASDRDEGRNARITYSISGTEPNLPFQIDSVTGVISVTSGLDYEIKKQYLATVKAVDDGDVKKTSEVNITVDVVDVNDNPPVFEVREYNAHVSESASDGHVILYVTATDKDTGVNADLQYAMGTTTGQGCSFTVATDDDSKTGKTVGKLQVGIVQPDYEKENLCVVKILVYDHQDTKLRHTATTTVTISIEDVNDNSPVFVGAPYNVSISRDVGLDYSLFSVKATDMDSGQNGEVSYSLKGVDSDYVQIFASSGKVTIKKSLNSAPDNIYITVTATDGGTPPRSAVTMATIHITDLNPSPTFKKSYTFNVIEQSQPETFDQQVEAVDWTNNQLQRCQCVYELSSPQDYFTIDSSSGKLTQIKVIDRETVGDSMFIPIKATDNGEPPKSTETKIEIKIQDINDNFPHFSVAEQNQDFTVHQNSHVGSSIGNVSYTDEDSVLFSKVSMSVMFVMPPTAAPLFRLDEDGKIYINGSLATNNTDNYDIRMFVRVKSADPVQTSAAESLIDTATLNLHVIYYSTNTAPTFSKSVYKYKLPFLTKMQTVIDVGISAFDADNDVIAFHMIGENPRDIFQMDSVTAKIELQYDVDGTIPTSIKFRVVAIDNNIVPQTSYATVEIAVTNSVATECLTKADAQNMRDDADVKTTFTILFAVMVALLSIAVIALVFTVYKWRRAQKGKLRYADTNPMRYESAKPPVISTTSYDQPENAEYTPLEGSSFTGSEGMQNPAYASSGDIQPPRNRTFHEPPADYDDVNPEQINLQDLGHSRQSLHS